MLDDSAARRAPNDGSIELLEFQARRVATPALLHPAARPLPYALRREREGWSGTAINLKHAMPCHQAATKA
jgi:hypothetical protein